MTLPEQLLLSDLLRRWVRCDQGLDHGAGMAVWMHPPVHRVLGWVSKPSAFGNERLVWRLNQLRGLAELEALVLDEPAPTDQATVERLPTLIDAALLDRHQEVIGTVADAAIESMTLINSAPASVLATLPDVRACTDITGYGLAGHGSEMAAASGAMIVIEWSRVPVLPGAAELAATGHVPGGTGRNRAYLTGRDANDTDVKQIAPRVTAAATLDEAALALAFDPQTSGGLLFGVPPPLVRRSAEAFASAGVMAHEIGEVREGFGLHFV